MGVSCLYNLTERRREGQKHYHLLRRRHNNDEQSNEQSYDADLEVPGRRKSLARPRRLRSPAHIVRRTTSSPTEPRVHSVDRLAADLRPLPTRRRRTAPQPRHVTRSRVRRRTCQPSLTSSMTATQFHRVQPPAAINGDDKLIN